MTAIEALEASLHKLESGPALARKLRKSMRARFSMDKPRDRWALLRGGLWLRLMKEPSASLEVFQFLAALPFTGDFSLWVSSEIAICFLITDDPRVGEAETAELQQRIRSAGVVPERLAGRMLDRSIAKLRASSAQAEPLPDYECTVLEDILFESRVMQALGPTGEYSEQKLIALISGFEAELISLAGT